MSIVYCKFPQNLILQGRRIFHSLDFLLWTVIYVLSDCFSSYYLARPAENVIFQLKTVK